MAKSSADKLAAALRANLKRRKAFGSPRPEPPPEPAREPVKKPPENGK
jgi:hypothetical protein